MEIPWELHQEVGAGANPAAFHSPDNVLQVFYTVGGRLYAMRTDTPFGEFDARVFTPGLLASQDEGVQHLKLTYLPRINVFAAWLNAAGEQRLAVFVLKQDLTDYIDVATITMQQGTPVASFMATLENPSGIVSSEQDETDSEAFPGSRLLVYLRMGDSERLLLGTFYLDSINSRTGDPVVKITARNASGKLLKDQTFDELGLFPAAPVHAVISDMLALAGVAGYNVQPSILTFGVEYPPNMTILDGVLDYIKMLTSYVIKEDERGHFAVGEPTYEHMHQASTYAFNRGSDCISREVLRSDMDVFSRLCVHTPGFVNAAYRDLAFRENWSLPQQKTLFVELPEEAGPDYVNAYADFLQPRLGGVGVIETFVGPIRPQLLPEDAAEITSESGSKLLGTTTHLVHYLGKRGFLTQFTVDSGGQLRKPMITELIKRASATPGKGGVIWP
jgi:hypothetical protein